MTTQPDPSRRIHRQRSAKVTKADYARAAEFLRGMGITPTAVEIAPDKVRIVIDDGRDLTFGDDEAILNAELAEFRRANGYG